MHLHDKEWNDLGVHVGRRTPIMISALGRCDDETQCGQDNRAYAACYCVPRYVRALHLMDISYICLLICM